jgi:hypothetical protein
MFVLEMFETNILVFTPSSTGLPGSNDHMDLDSSPLSWADRFKQAALTGLPSQGIGNMGKKKKKNRSRPRLPEFQKELVLNQSFQQQMRIRVDVDAAGLNPRSVFYESGDPSGPKNAFQWKSNPVPASPFVFEFQLPSSSERIEADPPAADDLGQVLVPFP